MSATEQKADAGRVPDVGAPSMSQDAVMVASEPMPAGSVEVRGYDFNEGVDYSRLLDSYLTSGFQATNFGLAVQEIRRMVSSCTAVMYHRREIFGSLATSSVYLHPPGRQRGGSATSRSRRTKWTRS